MRSGAGGRARVEIDAGAASEGRHGAPDRVDEVILQRKAPIRRARGRAARSARTKAKSRGARVAASAAELEKRLEVRSREPAEAREQQADAAEVVRGIYSSLG